MKVIVDPVVR